MTKKSVSLTHFSSEEIAGAYKQFNNLYDESVETPLEYLERKRKRDMNNIIHLIIENELDSTKRKIFSSVFFGGEKISDVACQLGICLSNAYKHYDKALKIIEKNLKYVILYQNCCRHEKLTPLEQMKLRKAKALNASCRPAISMRIYRLMQKENVSKEDLCRCLDFEEKHFDGIFCGDIQPTAEEIVLLSDFFGVSSDYILKGDLS